ncbi:intraflagellar transport protein 25 homolog isoform X1 [Vombatus ursinus]|uniref:intraflagellar transport protein 25 homolog isoform X1 n=1 Tax=Vombatus ursinus TaxID=29139 RepID=UPI000FFD3AEE|nr:intraflagellar transport protein 25 homolog isoform X1 [Vombatus ursinus]
MRMVDLCLASEGTEVILATSSDEKYPPENIIDGNSATFWATTGMFPQEFIICFHKHVKIEKLSLQCYFGHTAFQRSPQGFKYGKLVRSIRIDKSNAKEPVDFERWVERDLVHTEGQLQMEEFMFRDGYATHLRIVIKSAFDHFVSVHRVSIEGLDVSSLT